jgi:hypothetical protein
MEKDEEKDGRGWPKQRKNIFYETVNVGRSMFDVRCLSFKAGEVG